MARPSHALIDALRETAARLRGDAPYRWTHMGACNCGHLAQTVTQLSPEEIHRVAQQKAGDWRDQAIDYCPRSGYPIDHILDRLFELGLRQRDVEHLERLSDPLVIRRLPVGSRELSYRSREDLLRYLEAWASLLEAQLEAMPEGEGMDRPTSGVHALPGAEQPGNDENETSSNETRRSA